MIKQVPENKHTCRRWSSCWWSPVRFNTDRCSSSSLCFCSARCSNCSACLSAFLSTTQYKLRLRYVLHSLNAATLKNASN